MPSKILIDCPKVSDVHKDFIHLFVCFCELPVRFLLVNKAAPIFRFKFLILDCFQLLDVSIVKDQKTAQSQGFAFITVSVEMILLVV